MNNTVKLIVTILTAIGLLGGGLFFFEDRYINISEARNMEKRMEENTIRTFEKQQRILDMRFLEQLQIQKSLAEKELERDPGDELLRHRLKKIEKQIDILEDSLYE